MDVGRKLRGADDLEPEILLRLLENRIGQVVRGPADTEAEHSERAVEHGRRRGSPATDRERACRTGSAGEEVPTCEPGHDVRDKSLKKRTDGG